MIKRMLRWLINLVITSLLFFPEEEFYAKPEDFGLAYEDLSLITADKVKLHGWFLPAENAVHTLLFFHGNAGNISGRLFKAEGWVKRGVSVLLFDYRGYGKSQGDIETEADLYQDAEAALAWLIQEKKIPVENILLYGESLGSVPAADLAARYNVKGLILEVPFTSLAEIAKVHYPWVPVSLLKDFTLRNIDKIPLVKSPVFITHGTDDEVCPYWMGEKLYQAATSRKKFVRVGGGAHNNLQDIQGKDFFDEPYDFFFAAP